MPSWGGGTLEEREKLSKIANYVMYGKVIRAIKKQSQKRPKCFLCGRLGSADFRFSAGGCVSRENDTQGGMEAPRG